MTSARLAHCQAHKRHVGICPACQRATLAVEREQLEDALAQPQSNAKPEWIYGHRFQQPAPNAPTIYSSWLRPWQR